MLCVVRRLQEHGQERKMPLYMRFMDFADRELLWEVLTRLGVPAKILTVIRQFQDDMRPRVRTDDAEHSEWFDVTERF